MSEDGSSHPKLFNMCVMPRSGVCRSAGAFGTGSLLGRHQLGCPVQVSVPYWEWAIGRPREGRGAGARLSGCAGRPGREWSQEGPPRE